MHNQPRSDYVPPQDGPDPTIPAVISFGGLFFLDGTDSRGRKVAVINASKLPGDQDRRDAALQHVLASLEPYGDETGDGPGYVLVVYYTGPAPPGILRWLAGAYGSLSYRLRKGVKCIALVNPSWFMTAVVNALMPLVSSKAYKKVVIVRGCITSGTPRASRRRRWACPSCTPSEGECSRAARTGARSRRRTTSGAPR